MKSRKIIRDGREWEIPDAFYRISIKVLIKNDEDRLLVVQDTTNDTWEIPGGGLDHGETIEQTARREVQEELGVELSKVEADPIAITVGQHPNNYLTLMLYYWGELANYNFSLEKKFNSKFVDQDEFLGLDMLGDEAPIKQHVAKLW